MSKANAKKRGNPEELLSAEEKQMFACKVWGLQEKLAMERERSDFTRTHQMDLKQKLVVLSEDLKLEREKTLSISCDMGAQIRQLQGKHTTEIESLLRKIEEQSKALADKDDKIRELVDTQEEINMKKEEEIGLLKTKIEEMDAHFNHTMKVSLAGHSWQDTGQD